jgi:twinkle protein
MQNNVTFKGSAQRLQKRNISEKTCEKYKIYRDEAHLRFAYHDSFGRIQGFKTKDKLKNFKYEGNKTDTLFGQHLFEGKDKLLIITEGELDAASMYEVYGQPCVSLPHGAAGAKKDIFKQIDWIKNFETIILFFDKDDVGQKAQEEVAALLPFGKVKLANLCDPYKDASDALQAKDTEALRHAIWDAIDYRPNGIIDGKSLLVDITTPNQPCEHEYPFAGLQSKTLGIRYSELTTICAGTGQGKSTLCRQLATHLLSKKEKVGYIALEESNRRTALGLMSVAVGKPLHLGEHDFPTLKHAYDSTILGWNLFLYDHFGSLSPDIIYNRIEYMAVGLDVKVVFLDHLSILMSGMDGSFDERRLLDKTMTNLRELVQKTKISLFLVSHLRRTQNDKSHEEGARVSLAQLRGSQAIAQLSDNVFGLERDQQASENQDQSVLRVLKNRYSGDVGIASTLQYNKTTCKFDEITDPIFSPNTDF